MTSAVITRAERRTWRVASVVALFAHVGVAVLALTAARKSEPVRAEPVVLVELPLLATQPQAVPPPVPVRPIAGAARPAVPVPLAKTPPLAVPPARAPRPVNPVPLSQPAQPAAQPAAAVMATPGASPATAPVSVAAADPRARKQEVDYFALVGAHLNRRKVYPAEARQARQQGVVVVRFTVDRSGNVDGISVKRSSGHAILDAATLALVQRVAPLPRMPASMPRDRLTLSLPIDYSLRTD